MPGARRSYDSHFKEGAVRVVRGTGKSIAKAADDLGVPKATLTNWVIEDRRRRGERLGPATWTWAGPARWRRRSLSYAWSVMSSSGQWSFG
jgi:transposase-like protein